METELYARHNKRWYKPRQFSGRQATINGRPAYIVAEERNRERNKPDVSE
jgi:hypothetical protein